MTALLPTRDEDFDWLAGDAVGRPELRLPPGGVDTVENLAIIRAIHLSGRPGAWMMVADGEVVGLCGAVRPTHEPGAMEIGYGVAPSRRRLGHAARAVAAMIEWATRDATIREITAVTAVDNLSSQAVLLKNGFVESGRETREEDGPVILWRRCL